MLNLFDQFDGNHETSEPAALLASPQDLPSQIALISQIAAVSQIPPEIIDALAIRIIERLGCSVPVGALLPTAQDSSYDECMNFTPETNFSISGYPQLQMTPVSCESEQLISFSAFDRGQLVLSMCLPTSHPGCDLASRLACGDTDSLLLEKLLTRVVRELPKELTFQLLNHSTDKQSVPEADARAVVSSFPTSEE